MVKLPGLSLEGLSAGGVSNHRPNLHLAEPT